MENNSLIISYMKFSLQECVFFPIQKIVIFKTDFPCPINDAFSTRKKKALITWFAYLPRHLAYLL